MSDFARLSRAGLGLRCVLWLCFALVLTPSAVAQVTTGTILGVVTDQSGGVVPDATVTATNLETGFERSVTTDDVGNYTLANMPIGTYRLKAEMPGFRVSVNSSLTLIVDQKLRSDFVLMAGAEAEVVEVRGTATLLQTDQPDINQIVQEKEIRALPLNGRDFFSLLLLTNGLQDTSNDQGGATTNVTFSVNGMRPEANSVTLDGIEMSSVRESDVDLRPNLDSISEFKVLTSAFSAEYGHTAGGVISIQTKGGTNEFHGNLFEFHRNEALNASNFFRNPVNPQKAPLKQHTFGGMIGGPIRKNKTFFSLDYQGYRVSKINEAFAKVPEVPFRNGDFSSLLPDTGIFDPATGSETQFRDPSRATASNPEGLNIIPVKRFHPFAKALLDAVALPNLPKDYPLGNYFVRQPHRITGNEAGVRLDHVFSTKDNGFFRYRWNDSLLNTADALARPDGPMPGIGLEVGDDSRGIVQGGTHRDRNNNGVLSEVHVFNSRLVNEARVGFHRYHLDVVQHAYGMNLAEKFGLKGVNTGPLYSGLPIIYLDNYNSIGGDDWKPLYFRETSIQLNDNLTYMVGRHSFKTGFEYRRRDENNYYAIFPAGAFWVGTASTSYKGWWWQGHELADLLLGLPSMGFRGRRFGSPLLRDQQYSMFLQDDWKLNDRLTLNLGFRYEYVTPFYSPDNEISMFDMQAKKLLLAGKNGVSRYIVNPDKNNWMPRVGLAYKFDAKTTLRAGFGVYFDPSNNKRDDIKFNPPFYRQYSTWMTWNFWSPAPPPFEDPGSFPTGYDIQNIDKNLRTGYSEQYNLAVQRELPHGMLFEAAYVGSQAHKLPYNFNLNQPSSRGTPAPIPNLGRINVVTNVGNMVYHSGQFKLERRFGKELFFLTSYTWSKSIDNVSSAAFGGGVTGGVQNIFDPSQNRGVSDWDIPHRVAFSYVYDLPVGKGRRFLGDAPKVWDSLLGGWQMTGVLIASSGVPGTVYVGASIPGGDARPDLIRNPNLSSDARSVARWFDTGAFVIKRDAQGNILPGNAGRNIFRGPSYQNLDLGLIKMVPIREGVRVHFRAEFFNITNTPHFALPVRRMADAAFGKITHTRNPVNYGSTATSFANRMIQFALKLEF
jgi:hypothetical protein